MTKTYLFFAGAIAVSTIFSFNERSHSQETITQATLNPESRIRDLQTDHKAKDLFPLEQPPLAQAPQTLSDSIFAQAPTQPVPPREGFYVSISGDARFISKATIEPIDLGISVHPGFGINAAVGYRFPNNLRVEGEFSYGSNQVNEVNLPGIPATTTPTLTTNTPFVLGAPLPIPGVGTIPAGTTIPAGIVLNPGPPLTLGQNTTIAGVTIPAGTDLSAVPGLTVAGGTTATTTVVAPALAPTTVNADGRISTLSGLLNLYYDIPTGTRFAPYVGGGAGISRFSAHDISLIYPGIGALNVSDSSTVFAYQIRAGVAYNLNSNSAVTLGYRFFNITKPSFDVPPLGELKIKGAGVHNIELGFRYFF